MATTIIGLTGKMQSGKDTVCSIAEHFSGKRVCRRAFADHLKREVAVACEVTVDRIERNKELYRPILQWWGTEFRRGVKGYDYWVKKMEHELQVLAEKTEDLLVFVTDIRFPNEAELIRKFGGTIARVVRGDPGAAGQHSSEVAMDGYSCDYTILNNGDLVDLQEEVQKLLCLLTKPN